MPSPAELREATETVGLHKQGVVALAAECTWPWEMQMDVHVYIGVTDLQRGIAFYTHGLGLRLRRHLAANWVELEGASVPIFLLLSDRPPDFAGPWTVHLDFITEDLDAAVRQAQAAGAALQRAIQERQWGRMANMADPFGNSFDVIEFAPGGYERIAHA